MAAASVSLSRLSDGSSLLQPPVKQFFCVYDDFHRIEPCIPYAAAVADGPSPAYRLASGKELVRARIDDHVTGARMWARSPTPK